MTIAAILEGKGGEVIAVDSGATVREAVQLLAERRIGAVVVTDGERPAGMLSERDIVYCLASRGAEVLDMPVTEVMTAPPVTVESRVSALAALSNMSKRRIRHLPVVEEGALVGLVSIGDLVAYRIRRIEEEADAMRAYIQGA
jgi:CBS domain-containing protein